MNYMTNVDHFLASSLEKTIKSNLGEMTVNKIRGRLFEKFGISITQSMQEFEKLDHVLREFFGAGAVGLEEKFLENICSIKSKQDRAEKRFTISDEAMTQSILSAFSDEHSSKILNALSNESLTIENICKKCDIPQTTGYRKINSLINDGLVTRDGYDKADNGRKIDKYSTLFDNVKIDIVKNRVTVKVQFAEKVLQHSSILHVVYNI